MNINDRIIEGILTKMADRAEKNIKSGAKWAGQKAKQGLATLGKKAAYGAGKLVRKGIDAFKKGPTHTVGESSVYDRIIDMLLEARVEMFIEDRLDEGIVKARNKAMKNKFTDSLRHQEAPPAGRSGKIALSSREGEAASDHEVRMARKTKVPTDASEKRAVGRDNLRKGDTFRSDEAKEEKGMSPDVKGAIRQDRFEKATGISPAKSEDARQKKHHETYGKAAPGRAIKARGRRQIDNP